ncbi:L-talarate/galactarate dehydratase [Ornithinicoccus halotolerans]|uniref:L-talarate/galactarate dehydratase n=1 Tax=Ornithinicoccus halotolerans TaxID=1748220 RepID=UPI001294FFE5|nr:mandelate racemase/muconate lactonizing enzyme family protein [Ornithinicoccus halotolerans]
MSQTDAVTEVTLSRVVLPLPRAISDAKVLTGRQKPLTEVQVLTAEVTTADGHQGLGISYSKRAGGPGQYAHAAEVAGELLGQDPSDIQRLWTHLVWAGASVGRSGLATQAVAALDIALWDLKARRAGLPLAKLLGAHRDAVPAYNTSGGFLSSPLEEVLDNAAGAVESGIGGIKVKVGHPEAAQDLARVAALREALPDHVALMVDANQQWDRATALRVCRQLEPYGLTWIEEPLDAYDAEGHARLNAALDTPVATGEMLTSPGEHAELLRHRSVDVLQPDAARVGGITQFLKIAAAAAEARVDVAPHFAMELHVHLAAAYEHGVWVEHFDWLEPLFEERLELADGTMLVPDRPGLGLTLSGQARDWTAETVTLGG